MRARGCGYTFYGTVKLSINRGPILAIDDWSSERDGEISEDLGNGKAERTAKSLNNGMREPVAKNIYLEGHNIKTRGIRE